MKEVPPRQPKEEQSEFVRKRVQKLPASFLAGYNPLYAMRNQLKRFAPGADYVKDGAAEDDGVFDHYLVPREAHEAMQAGLAKEGNDRVIRTDPSGVTSRTGSGLVAPEDKITLETRTMDEMAQSLPSG